METPGGTAPGEETVFTLDAPTSQVVLTFTRVSDFELITITVNGIAIDLSTQGVVAGNLTPDATSTGSLTGTFNNDFNAGSITLNSSEFGFINSFTVTMDIPGTASGAYATDVQIDTLCFCSGTEIATLNGIKTIESLSEGDKVFTVDNDYQPIRWIGSTSLDASDLAASPKLKPIRIAAGALGNGMPEQDLMVSRQHRILMCSVAAERMFGQREILVPAVKLLSLDGVDLVEEAQDVTYWHMLFDCHEIVFANGTQAESLFTGPEALKAVSSEARREIFALFPELEDREYTPQPARFIPEKGKHMREFVARLAKNVKPAVDVEHVA